MHMMRLLMVDDHVMLTEALAARLSVVDDLWVVGRCCTTDRALPEMAIRLLPDVITVDPVSTCGGRLVRELRERCPSAGVVVLTGGCDVEPAVDAARAGASAWLPKERGIDELTAVLRGVCRGDAWFPPEVLGAVLRELRADAHRAGERAGPLDVLSDRERDVLMGMATGKRAARIAEDLVISAETVRTHTRGILAKLQVHSQLEAVSVARAAGLRVPAPDDGDGTALAPFPRGAP